MPGRPAQYVSTKLNIVLKNIPILAGSAMRQVSWGMGSEVSKMARFIKNEAGRLTAYFLSCSRASVSR